MTTKRSSGAAGRRLRVEALEDRAVPATDVIPVPPGDDPTKPVVVGDLPSDPGPIETMADGEIIVTASSEEPPVSNPSAAELDLAATAAIDKVKPSLGDVVTVTVTVKNNGLEAATGVTATATLPSGLTFVSAAPSQGTGAYDTETGTWAVGAVAANGSAVLKIKARVIDPAAQSMDASITHSDQTDPESGNNSASLNVTPVLGAVSLSKAVSVANPVVKSNVIYTLTVRNAGPGTARDVTVTDTLGTGLTFLKALPPSRGTFSAASKIWTIAALPAGASASIQIIAQVTAVGRIESPATITATGIDETRSKLEAMVAVNGVTTSPPALFTYHTGPGFKPGPAPMPPVSTGMPGRPILLALPRSGAAQLLLARGFILPGASL